MQLHTTVYLLVTLMSHGCEPDECYKHCEWIQNRQSNIVTIIVAVIVDHKCYGMAVSAMHSLWSLDFIGQCVMYVCTTD